MTFQDGSAATLFGTAPASQDTNADFRTPANPEAGWASRNPDKALLFLFVSPRDCGALDELMAV
ncbi:MAG TPA: hypothetical protein VIA98_07120 [Allosphingosinicella sp.]|jgi:hypothetical protein